MRTASENWVLRLTTLSFELPVKFLSNLIARFPAPFWSRSPGSGSLYARAAMGTCVVNPKNSCSLLVELTQDYQYHYFVQDFNLKFMRKCNIVAVFMVNNFLLKEITGYARSTSH